MSKENLPITAKIFSLAILALFLPSAVAGGQFTDTAADVTYEGPVSTALPSVALTESIDLLALDAIEDEQFFTFAYKVTSLNQPSPTVIDYATSFTWKDADFRIHVTRSRADPSAPTKLDARLEQADNGIYSRIQNLEITEDSGAGTLTVTLPKNSIISLEGHAPVYGSELVNVTTQAWSNAGAGDAGGRFTDQMPNDAPGVIVYEKGGSANGHLVLEAPDPVRLSNGEATTFVFQAHLQNYGTVDDAATLTLVGAPANWDVSVQAAQMVPAEDERPIFALVTIPFGHEHGGFTGFDLVATSTRDPSVTASVKFGVQHTLIPFPAGHHSELYLHATSEDQGALGNLIAGTTNTMNTLPDEDGLPEALAKVAGTTATWDIPIGPALGIGMDFDTEGVGSLGFELMPLRIGDATISAELLLMRGDQQLVQLSEIRTQAITTSLQAPTSLVFEIHPTPESDYIPYVQGQNLVLRIVMDSEVPLLATSQTLPSISVPSFMMRLPLNEYADVPVWDEGIESNVGLVPIGAAERVGKPGTSLVYKFTLTNNGPTRDDLELGMAGNAAGYAEYVPTKKIRLAPGESSEVSMVVKIPTDLKDGTRLEVILLARSEADPSNIGLVRTGTTIDSSADNLDESGEFAGNPKSTPAPPLMFTILALAVLLRKRRS